MTSRLSLMMYCALLSSLASLPALLDKLLLSLDRKNGDFETLDAGGGREKEKTIKVKLDKISSSELVIV